MEEKKPNTSPKKPKAHIILHGDLSHLPVPTFITTETCGKLSSMKSSDTTEPSPLKEDKKRH